MATVRYTDWQMQEIERCANSFPYFSANYLVIQNIDKEDQLLTLNDDQRKLERLFYDHCFLAVLKDRKRGISTLVAGYFFWKCCFSSNENALMMAQSAEDVQKIFKKHRKFKQHCPRWLTGEIGQDTKDTMEFKRVNSWLRCRTWNSEDRGDDISMVHYSEEAFYGDSEATKVAVNNSLVNAPLVISETTANGLNHYYRFWFQEFDEYKRVFFSWLDAEFKTSDIPLPTNLTDHEKSYIEEGDIRKEEPTPLTGAQARWFIQTLRTNLQGNLEKFKQEHPRNAEEAFIASGGPYFPTKYTNVHNDARLGSVGWLTFQKPEQLRLYVMGVDTASGSEAKASSYSAAVILDVTDAINYQQKIKDNANFRPRVKVVATYRRKQVAYLFAKEIHQKALEYHALIVPEVWRGGRLGNMESDGQTVVDHLQYQEYPYVYRRQKRDKVGGQFLQLLGFATTGTTRPVILARVHEFLAMDWMVIECPRLMSEINSFRYDEKGKPCAPDGEYDDLVMSLSLGMAGLDQVEDYQQEIQFRRKPRTNEEYIQFEVATGMDPDEYEGEWLDTPFEDALFGNDDDDLPPSQRLFKRLPLGSRTIH